MSDLSDQLEAGEKEDIEAKIAELREVLPGEDADAIEEKSAALGEVTGKLAERAYAKQNEAAGGAGEAGGADQAAGSEPANDDAVDAEFEEVKEDKAG